MNRNPPSSPFSRRACPPFFLSQTINREGAKSAKKTKIKSTLSSSRSSRLRGSNALSALRASFAPTITAPPTPGQSVLAPPRIQSHGIQDLVPSIQNSPESSRTQFSALITAIIFLIATATSLADPPTTQHVTVDLTTPTSAVRTMLAAVDRADASALRASFYAPTDPQTDLVTAYAELIVAARHLRDSARDKFAADNSPNGNPNPNLAPNPSMIRDGSAPGGPGPEDQQNLDNATVQIDGDAATVQLPDRPKPIKLQKTNNQWQIDLSDYAAIQPAQLAEQTEVNHNLAQALDEAADEITAGKYASPQEAEAAVQQKIHAVIAPQLKNLATTTSTTQPGN